MHTTIVLIHFSVSYPSTIPTPTIRATTDFAAGEGGLYASYVTLLCEFEFPAWDNVTFEVQWIVDGMVMKEEQLSDERVSRLGEKLLVQDEQGGFVAGSRVS